MENNSDSALLEQQLTKDELENVQSVIQLTKENIDALNERFQKFKPSPKIYLDEYQDLTSKLHQLNLMEQKLVEKMQLIQDQIEVRQINYLSQISHSICIDF
jgi:B-Raf proto-oncogene serine/threonine-protein kinase